MVSYSFHKRFVAPIRSGEKRQTIRSYGRRLHAQPGNKLQLYCGMRTKHCEKIADTICTQIQPIKIAPAGPAGILMVSIDRAPWLTTDETEIFAKMDGFVNLTDMQSFWLENYGAAAFDGVIIRWADINQTSPA